MKSKNIKLRALEPEDIDLLYKWENDPEIWHFSNTRTPFSRFDIEQYVLSTNKDLYKDRQVRFMIDMTGKEKLQTIGTIDLFDFDPLNQRAGVGIFIIPEARQNGFADEALQLLIQYAFNTLNLHQLYCNITSDNKKSIDLFKKNGFSFIGEKRDWILKNNDWINELIFQRLNDK